jgi:hypothetical protein
MGWRQKWQTAQRLSRQDWGWWIGAMALLPVVAVLVQGLGLRRTQHCLRCVSPDPHRSAPRLSPPEVKRLAAMVTLADRYSRPWSNCLRRSLTLAYGLRWYGVAADLRIGMRRHQGQMESHAWLEWRGLVLGDRADIGQDYRAFAQTIQPD